ncbi:MAG: Ribose-5-phosphate isomerase A [Candidatus Anoxychlamydiales bacterium]|nr:Ribose-5-phosphate isomerase A [Candidatus Anoxychlamydiales bacterium]
MALLSRPGQRCFEGFFSEMTKTSGVDEKVEPIDPVKVKLGQIAANEIKDNQIVGLGTGATAAEFIKCLAKRCKEGLRITVVASSNESFMLAQELGISVYKLGAIDIENEFFLDVYVDEADEVDENFNMIKGRGGALHRAKVLASSSKKVIIMINSSKKVKLLGRVDLPIEVTKFGSDLAKKRLADLGYSSEKRKNKDDSPYVTDNDNYILDVKLTKLLENPEKAHGVFKNITGVVETGIFIDLVDKLIVSDTDENCEIINAKKL